MQLISHTDYAALSRDLLLSLPNDAEPMQQQLHNVQTIELHFPKFTDGRAFSQALMLRRRCGFKGEIRATGDVLVDQLSQMQRCGFSSAVLRANQDFAKGRQLLSHFSAFYQGDLLQAHPLFAR
ncbi:MAG: DUF934 domain-containing protein [Limnohabitans sp.]|nr:DUF934 domain-containing protein [Limnohabitans sp.]